MDKTKRISLIKEVADLFDMIDGDYINFYAIDGNIVIHKATRPFNGFDLEGEDIKKRIRDKEEELEFTEIDRQMDSDPDEDRRIGEDEYRTYLEQREKLKKNNSGP